MNWKPVDDLPLAIRHVAEGEARCARQIALIARLRADGHDTALAETLLVQLEQILELMREHQQRLQAMQPT